MTQILTKQRIRRVVDDLPEDVSLEEVIERLVVLYKVERGLDQVRRGEDLQTQDEVEAYFRNKAGKSS